MTFAIGTARLELSRGDITAAETDAIANAANSSLVRGGGVDGAIHRAAGPELAQALERIRLGLPGGRLPPGQAVLTPGFGLRARHVIHCVGPIYAQEGADAPRVLASCYRAAVALCREHGITSIAFPSISTGVYGYPPAEAAAVALAALKDELSRGGGPSTVEFVLFDEDTLCVYRTAAAAALAGPGST